MAPPGVPATVDDPDGRPVVLTAERLAHILESMKTCGGPAPALPERGP